MTYRYGHLEATLAKVCTVAPQDIGAFRGKIRNFRNLGLPDLEKPGSGARVAYSLEDAVAIRLALELSWLGVKPAAIVAAFKAMNPRAISALAGRELAEPDGEETDLYWFITRGLVTSMFVGLPTIAKLAELATNSNSFAAMNVSRLAREVVAKLGK
jgi:hypothetical protein